MKKNYLSAIAFFELSNNAGKHYKTYEKLFLCLKNIGKRSEAFECIKNSYHLNPKCDKVSVEYATELTEFGDLETAQKILSETLKRNPSYKPAEKLLIEIGNKHGS